LVVASERSATNDDDGDGRQDQPERDEDCGAERGGDDGDERRTDDERDTEHRDSFARSGSRVHNKAILHQDRLR
jgi:hypothetical protein